MFSGTTIQPQITVKGDANDFLVTTIGSYTNDVLAQPTFLPSIRFGNFLFLRYYCMPPENMLYRLRKKNTNEKYKTF